MVCCWCVFKYMFVCVSVYSDVCMTNYLQMCTRLKLKPFMSKLCGDTITTNSLVAGVLVYRTRDDHSIPSW